MHPSYPLRAGRRALAVLGTAALGVGVFALPAAAQTPAPADVFVDDYSPIAIGDDPELFGMRIEFDDGLGAGEHTVTATVEIDAPDDTFAIGLDDGSGSDCPANDAATEISCSWDWAETDVAAFWEFRYRPLEDAEPGHYDYTVTFAVDGATVATVEDDIEVTAAEDDGGDPFLYDSVQFDAEPGATTTVTPKFLQNTDLAEGTVALAYGVSEPDFLFHGSAQVTAPYENCIEEFWGGEGITCIITDVDTKVGDVLAPSEPISITVNENTPGPQEICGCYFEVRALDAAELEAEYGDVDTDSGKQVGLDLTQEGGDPDQFDSVGYLDIRTTENPYNLSVADSNAKGAKGDQVTLTVPVKNLGPADASTFFDGPGTYGLIGELPKGLELVKIDSDGGTVFCFESDDEMVKDSFPGSDLKNADFVCLFGSLPDGESFDFKFTVKITDASANGKGTLEVAAMDYEGYPSVEDADTKNNKADITVNGSGSANLPKTGASLGLVIGVAALVLVAGVVLMVVTSRRRKAAAEE
jgi:LPXTG-motif cell wall-anchored protein